MLKFRVYENGKPANDFTPRDAHLVGVDDVGVRATISFEDGVILCDKSALGPSAMVLQIELEGVGDLMLQTCLLPERETPYILMLELARRRITRIIAKQEDWGLFDLEEDHAAAVRLAIAKDRFIKGLCAQHDDPAAADAFARESLTAAIDASEELTLAHADTMLEKRTSTGHLSKHTFGVGVDLGQDIERLAPAVASNFDYVHLPTPWRMLEPEEQTYNWTALDAWCEWAYKQRVPVVAGPLVSFTPNVVPDWLYIWEHDYDTIRDLLYEHIERVVTRYRGVIALWNVVSGIHVNDHFSFNFEQLMDLTRMAILLTKKVHTGCRTLVEITHPFGEYYAHNQRSIPPMMYAEMLLQSGVPFDGFGVKLLLGRPEQGLRMRDLLQVSAMLDKFNGLGKPVHVTATCVPSVAGPKAKAGDPTGGYWRKPWSPQVQSHWLEAFYKVTLSKPFVESAAWLDLVDHDVSELPSGALVGADMRPKPALKRLISMRTTMLEASAAAEEAGETTTEGEMLELDEIGADETFDDIGADETFDDVDTGTQK